MFSAIRKRVRVSPATVIAGLALVFAMTGGAYAAKKYLITSTKQISPSVLKALQGKAGAPGAPGAPGSVGPAGPQGAVGAAGTKGEAGTAGAKGAIGPAGATGPAGANGKNGNNGANGPTGPMGSPWAAGGTLPSGKTETGSWVLPVSASGGVTQISFPIPLAAPLPALNFPKFIPVNANQTATGTLTAESNLVTNANFSDEGECIVGAAVYDETTPTNIPASFPQTLVQTCISPTEFELSENAAGSGTGDTLRTGNPTGCPTAATAKQPAAEPGFLCVFASVGEVAEAGNFNPEIKKAGEVNNAGASTAGAIFSTKNAITSSSRPYMGGTWAVTAP